MTVRVVLLIASVVCFAFGALKIPNADWTDIGLAFFAASFLA